MSIEVIEADYRETNAGRKVMYCNSTMWAFGPVFYDGENPLEFIDWCNYAKGEPEIRRLNDAALSLLYQEWRMHLTELDSIIANGLDDENIEHFHLVDLHPDGDEIESCYYEGILLKWDGGDRDTSVIGLLEKHPGYLEWIRIINGHRS